MPGKIYRKDDLIGIRKARLASFILLVACFAAMFVIHIIVQDIQYMVIASAIVIAALILFWWFVYRGIILSEADFFSNMASDMRAVHRRLRTLESAIRQIDDGVVIVSEEEDLVLVNETAKRLFVAYDGVLDGSRYDEYAAGFSEKLETAAIIAGATEGRSPEPISVDGQYYKIGYVSLVPEKGKGRGAVAVISDVTESTKAENMQKEFVANVTHELKTPLAAIKGSTETLITGAVDDEETEKEFLNMIVADVDRMNRLVTDLMRLARMDHTDRGGDKSDSELVSLVRMSMKKIDMVAKEKSLTVNPLFADDLRVNLEMNRDRIEQVLLNVLGNAVKYTEEKGRVDVDIISGQNCVQIVIIDNGEGIPEKDLARVFERFFRVDKARTGRTGGSGLGLAISKQIVDEHGGAIGIESKYGRGTTVTISLPTNKGRGVPGIL